MLYCVVVQFCTVWQFVGMCTLCYSTTDCAATKGIMTNRSERQSIKHNVPTAIFRPSDGAGSIKKNPRRAGTKLRYTACMHICVGTWIEYNPNK